MSGPTPATRRLVIERDSTHGVPHCQWCGAPIGSGEYSLQHRRARGMGGSRDASTNLAANLVLMCGTGTTGCHGHVESHPREALDRGFRVSQGATPSRIAILTATRGLVLLDDVGGFAYQEDTPS